MWFLCVGFPKAGQTKQWAGLRQRSHSKPRVVGPEDVTCHFPVSVHECMCPCRASVTFALVRRPPSWGAGAVGKRHGETGRIWDLGVFATVLVEVSGMGAGRLFFWKPWAHGRAECMLQSCQFCLHVGHSSNSSSRNSRIHSNSSNDSSNNRKQ